MCSNMGMVYSNISYSRVGLDIRLTHLPGRPVGGLGYPTLGDVPQVNPQVRVTGPLICDRDGVVVVGGSPPQGKVTVGVLCEEVGVTVEDDGTHDYLPCYVCAVRRTMVARNPRARWGWPVGHPLGGHIPLSTDLQGHSIATKSGRSKSST
jgi:hypothetical protein